VRIPVFISFTELRRSADELVVLAGHVCTSLSGEAHVCFSEDDLVSGRLLLLIDAVDELPEEEAKRSTLAKIERFHKQYPKCQIVMTSRDYAYLHDYQEFNTYARFRVLPFDLRQATKLIEQTNGPRSVSKHIAKELVRRLQDVHGLTLNPLLVSIFVATSDFSTRDIPPNITEMFSKFTELMLGRWDQGKKLTQQYQSKLKDFVMCRLAFQMHEQRTTSLSLEAAKEFVKTVFEEIGRDADLDVLFEEIIYRSGLLIINDQMVTFRHHMFQEYFAGRGIPSSEYLGSVVTDEWWRTPIVFYFGSKPTSNAELVDLARGLSGRSFKQLYEGAVTVGLSSQACYLSSVADKRETLEWVVNALAGTCTPYVENALAGPHQYKVMPFIFYYLFGRDAVAGQEIVAVVEKIVAEQPSDSYAHAEDVPNWDMKMFWGIVGLIEAGNLEHAEKIVRKFQPSDGRLLLAIHMGCFYISHLRVSTPNQKRVAEDICKRLQPKISHLAQQTVTEMRGYLLDAHRGEIVILSETSNEALPDDEAQAIREESVEL